MSASITFDDDDDDDDDGIDCDSNNDTDNDIDSENNSTIDDKEHAVYYLEFWGCTLMRWIVNARS